MAAIDIFYPPRHAPGDKMAEAIARSGVVSGRKRVTFNDWASGDGVVQLFNVPADTFVHDVIVRIHGAFTGATSIICGDGGDPDRFMDTSTLAPGTAGYKSNKLDAQPGSGGHYYLTADTIDLTQAGTPTAGTLDAWIRYSIRASEYNMDSPS